MVNMTVHVSRNFYLTVSADRKAMEGEDISVIFEIDEHIDANSVRVDMKNGRAVDQRFLLNGNRQLFIKGELTNRGFLWMQVVFSLETGTLRKTNTYALHIFNSVVGITPWELVQQELEMLAFVEVRKDAETKDIVFYSLTADEVGRINISDWLNTTDLENAVKDLQDLTEEHTELIAALQQALDEEAINRENADADLRRRIDKEAQTRQEADEALNDKIDADIDNLATNYYTKTDIDELFEDQQSRVIYKDVVPTFEDLATTYPDPATGWTAIALDTNIQYRYNEDTAAWEQISYRTVDIDGDYTGLMTPEMLQQQETNTANIAEIQQFIDDLVLPDGIRKFYLIMQDDGTRVLVPTWDYRGELPNPEQPQEDETIIMVIAPGVIQYWKDQDIISEDVPAITYYGLGTVNTAGTSVYCLCISESGRQLYMVMPVQPPNPTTYYFLNMNDVAYQEDIENLQTQVNDLVTRANAIEAKDAEQDTRLESLEDRVDDSEAAVALLTTRVTDLEDRADANDAKNTEQDNRLTAVEAKNTEQDDRLDGVEQDIVDINNETASIRGEVTRLDGRIDNTNERIDITNLAVNQNATNIQTNATNIQTLFNTTERHTDQIQQLQQDVANNNEVVTNAIEDLAERVTTNEEKLEEHDGVLAGLQTQIDDNKVEFAESLSNLQTELDTTNTNVSQNTTDIANIKTDIDDINTDIDGVKDSVTDLTQVVNANKAAADAQFEYVSDTLDDHETRITTNANNISDLRGEYEANKEATDDAITDVDNKVDALTNRVTATETKNDQQDARLDDQATTIASNTSAIGGLQGRMTTAENNIIDLTGRMGASEASITTLQADVGELTTTVTDGLEAANNALEAHKVSGDHDDRYYTQNQVDSKIDAISVGLEVQDPVATFDDLATTYPDAESGWAAYVQDSGITYVFNGTEWKQFTGSSPIVSDTNDGIMTSTMLQQLNDNTDDIASLQTDIADFVTDAEVDEKLQNYTRHFEITPIAGSEVSIGSLGLNENETATISMNAVQAVAIGLRSSAQGGILSRGNSTTVTLTTYVPGTTQTIVTYAGYDGTNMSPSWINETPLLDILTKNNWSDTIDLSEYATSTELDDAKAELQESITNVETDVIELSDAVTEHTAILEHKVDYATQADETQQPIFEDGVFVKQIVADATVTSAWFGSAQAQSIGSYTKSPYGSIYGSAMTVTGKLLFMQWNETDVEAVLKYEIDLSIGSSSNGKYLPYAYAIPTRIQPFTITASTENSVSIAINFNVLNFSTIDGVLDNSQIHDTAVSFNFVPTQRPTYYYVYSTDGNQTWLRSTTQIFSDITARNGYVIGAARLNAQGTIIEFSNVGYGTVTYEWGSGSSNGIYMPMVQYGLQQQENQVVFELMDATSTTYQVTVTKSANDVIKTYDGKTLTGDELTVAVSISKSTAATTYVYTIPDESGVVTELSTAADVNTIATVGGYIIAMVYIKKGRAAVKFMNNAEIISPYAGTRYEEIKFVGTTLDALITLDTDNDTATMSVGTYVLKKDSGEIIETTLNDPVIMQWSEGALICYDEASGSFVRYAGMDDYDNVISTWAFARMVTANDNKMLAINGWGLYPTPIGGSSGGDMPYIPAAIVVANSNSNNTITFTNQQSSSIVMRAMLNNIQFYTFDGEAKGVILTSTISVNVSINERRYFYVYKNDSGVWAQASSSNPAEIINRNGYAWAVSQRYPSGGQITVTTLGMGVIEAPMTTNLRREAFFKAVDSTQAPIYWDDSSSGIERSIYLRAGEYQVSTSDRVFSEIVVTLPQQEFVFEHNATIIYDSIEQTFSVYSDGVIDQTLYNKYIVGTFYFVGNNRAMYIEKFGNYIDTPVTQGGGTANVIGLPPTFDVSDWTVAEGFTLPAGTYQFVGTTDAKRYVVRLSDAITLAYDFSSAIYFQESDLTMIRSNDTGAVPLDAIIIGSMNNVGVATVALNGIGAFPAST